MISSKKDLNYLITGCKGQLGSEFIKALYKEKASYKAVDVEQLDIGDFSAVMAYFSKNKPDIVINCAAYNLVDQAETDRDEARKANSNGPKYLAHASKKHNALLVHFSSDYVFDGNKMDGFYYEDDKVNPINTYGKSKLDGENYLKTETKDYLIFRLSWVYGDGPQNFIHKMKEWIEVNNVLNITFDEVSVPTSTKVIVDVTLKAINTGLTGLYHLTNTGYASRYEWAKFIVDKLKKDVLLLPANQTYFKLPAQRPFFSAMSNKKICEQLEITIPTWQESLGEFMDNMRD